MSPKTLAEIETEESQLSQDIADLKGAGPTEQVAAISTDQVAGLVTADVVALSTEQVSALGTADVAALSTEQVAALATADVAALSTAQVAELTPEQQAGTASRVEAAASPDTSIVDVNVDDVAPAPGAPPQCGAHPVQERCNTTVI